MRRPAIGPDDVAAVSFELLPTILTDLIIFPLSFEEFPGGDVPDGNEPSNAVGIIDDGPAVKGEVFSIYSA